MKSIHLKLEDSLAEELKEIAKVYHSNVSELIREGIAKLLEEKKNDIYYILTSVEECSQEETDELMEELGKLTKDGLKIVRRKNIVLKK